MTPQTDGRPFKASDPAKRGHDAGAGGRGHAHDLRLQRHERDARNAAVRAERASASPTSPTILARLTTELDAIADASRTPHTPARWTTGARRSCTSNIGSGPGDVVTVGTSGCNAMTNTATANDQRSGRLPAIPHYLGARCARSSTRSRRWPSRSRAQLGDGRRPPSPLRRTGPEPLLHRELRQRRSALSFTLPVIRGSRWLDRARPLPLQGRRLGHLHVRLLYRQHAGQEAARSGDRGADDAGRVSDPDQVRLRSRPCRVLKLGSPPRRGDPRIESACEDEGADLAVAASETGGVHADGAAAGACTRLGARKRHPLRHELPGEDHAHARRAPGEGRRRRRPDVAAGSGRSHRDGAGHHRRAVPPLLAGRRRRQPELGDLLPQPEPAAGPTPRDHREDSAAVGQRQCWAQLQMGRRAAPSARPRGSRARRVVRRHLADTAPDRRAHHRDHRRPVVPGPAERWSGSGRSSCC